MVRDEVDFGAAIAAESLGIPRATVSVLAAGGFLLPGLVAEPLREPRSEYGLPAGPRMAMLDGDLVPAPFPPGFRDPEFPLPAHAFSFRPHGTAPPRAVSDRAAVYFTLAR